ncbi:hypothetical protein T08_6646 [Trichinella sp. T8]|nr:hypothetical protein T08_6646 [Trichinella sp. T8]
MINADICHSDAQSRFLHQNLYPMTEISTDIGNGIVKTETRRKFQTKQINCDLTKKFKSCKFSSTNNTEVIHLIEVSILKCRFLSLDAHYHHYYLFFDRDSVYFEKIY